MGEGSGFDAGLEEGSVEDWFEGEIVVMGSGVEESEGLRKRAIFAVLEDLGFFG